MNTRLYIGLKRNGIWYNYAEMEKVKGGGLAALDGVEKTGAARLLTLLKKSVQKLRSEGGEELVLKEMDYFDLYVSDCWKIARESMKLINNVEKLLFPEFFFCEVCSTLGNEKYTEVNDDWDDLVEQGKMEEVFLEDGDVPYYWTELPVGITIENSKAFSGGKYQLLKREPLTIGKMLKMQKNRWARETEANMIFSNWDQSIIEIDGMNNKDFQLMVIRNPFNSFCKQFITTQEDQDAMEISESQFKIGYDAEFRQITCKHCGNEIGGYLDFTNFFQSLLPKRSIRGKIQNL